MDFSLLMLSVIEKQMGALRGNNFVLITNIKKDLLDFNFNMFLHTLAQIMIPEIIGLHLRIISGM